jgi:hypothetical protein
MVFGMLGRTPHSCGLTTSLGIGSQYRYDAYLRYAETAP